MTPKQPFGKRKVPPSRDSNEAKHRGIEFKRAGGGNLLSISQRTVRTLCLTLLVALYMIMAGLGVAPSSADVLQFMWGLRGTLF